MSPLQIKEEDFSSVSPKLLSDRAVPSHFHALVRFVISLPCYLPSLSLDVIMGLFAWRAYLSALVQSSMSQSYLLTGIAALASLWVYHTWVLHTGHFLVSYFLWCQFKLQQQAAEAFSRDPLVLPGSHSLIPYASQASQPSLLTVHPF